MEKLIEKLNTLVQNFASNLSDYINEIGKEDDVDCCFDYIEDTVRHLLRDYKKFAKKKQNNISDNEG